MVLADAGYWHGEQMDELTGRGITVLIPPDAAKRRGTRPGWDGGRYASCAASSKANPGALYRKRQVMIEPVFADTKFNRRIDRFLRRGRAAARSEWRTDHRHRQPAQALAPHHRPPRPPEPPGGRADRVPPTRTDRARTHRREALFTQQPPWEALAPASVRRV